MVQSSSSLSDRSHISEHEIARLLTIGNFTQFGPLIRSESFIPEGAWPYLKKLLSLALTSGDPSRNSSGSESVYQRLRTIASEKGNTIISKYIQKIFRFTFANEKNGNDICRRMYTIDAQVRSNPELLDLAQRIRHKFQFNPEPYGGMNAHERFCRTSAFFVLQAAKKITQNYSGMEILFYLALARHYQEMSSCYEPNKKFGTFRYSTEHSLMTPIRNKGNFEHYLPYKEQFRALADRPRTSDEDEPLTYITLKKLKHDTSESVLIIHTPTAQIPALMSRFERTFETICKTAYPDTEQATMQLLKDLGSLHWYLAIATPCNRGSAATIEKLVLAVLFSKGYIPESFNCMADLVAFTKNREVFSSEYHTMFSTIPKKDDSLSIALKLSNVHLQSNQDPLLDPPYFCFSDESKAEAFCELAKSDDPEKQLKALADLIETLTCDQRIKLKTVSFDPIFVAYGTQSSPAASRLHKIIEQLTTSK